MSRHRNVRALNVQEEYDGYDEVYGHSVEDDYCVSPSTAAEFMYDRSQQHVLSTFLSREPQIPEEGDEDAGSDEEKDSLQDSASFAKPQLTDVQQAQLYSCLEGIRNILGDSTPDHVLTDAVIKADFNQERALHALLNQQEAPKPQREIRNRRSRGTRVSGPTNKPAPNTAAPATGNTTDSGNTVDPAAHISAGTARMTFSASNQATVGFSATAGSNHAAVGFSATPDINYATVGFNATADGANDAGNNSNQLENDASTAAGTSGLETPKKEALGATSAANTPVSASKRSKQDKLDLKKEFERRKAGGKESINLVVIGHVDAGKSTLMGHVLYQLGFVNKRAMHKYEQEAKKMGKASFAYAWVLDETEEERSRGVTMDVAQTRFETDTKVVTLLDAPGHKDFIPNMITGAAQADVAILVVNATRGEFETGFETGGQTREHAMLVRSLGVFQLLVAVNKMDTVDWAKPRYDEITKKLTSFLKQAGFKEKDLTYVPCSGLLGENLTANATSPQLLEWYSGPHVVQQIDKFLPPERPIDKPLRLCVTDIFKGQGAGVSVAGTIQAGSVQTGDKVLVMPQGEVATVKSISIDDLSYLCAFAGDNILVTLVGIEMTNIGTGSILCDRVEPVASSLRFKARVVIFNIDVPITKGFPVEIHYQSLTEPAHIRRLISQLHKSSGEVVRNKPRCLTRNSNAVVEIEVERPICLELYKDYKDLGRFMLRSGGHTIAAGLVTEILDSKNKGN